MASQTSAARSSRVPPQETSPSTVPPQVHRFSIRAPKNIKKKYSVMRFNGGLKVDFQDWKQVKMQRENNMKDFKGMEEEMPTFGAGSEFGRAAREEAKRKKYGINIRKYKSENQPWILKTNGKSGKKFRGVKEGGVNDNAAYYIFSHAGDGTIEAYPLHEWYKFQLVQRYKTLSAEEAEEEFSRRDKVMNYFSLMLKKRLKNDEEDAELVDAEKRKRSNKKKEIDFKISEMDEWIDSDDDSDNSDNDDKENRKKSDHEDDDSKKKKKGKDLKKKKKKDSDDEAFEESDDGDKEGRELDYISDSSASESELEQQKEIKSVAEESGLKQLLESDDEDETEENKDKKSENGDEEGKEKNDKDKEKSGKSNDKEKSGKSNGKEKSGKSNGKEKSGKSNGKEKSTKKGTQKESSDSSDMETISEKNKDIAGPSRKRTLDSPVNTSQTKKFKTENNYSSSSYIPGSSESGITEDAVRRYLMRKPMTTTELLQKFKAKKTGFPSEKIVTIMTQILQKLNPTSQKIKGKMYFSIGNGS